MIEGPGDSMRKKRRDTLIYKTLHRKLKLEEHEHHNKSRGELKYSGRVDN
jgi:hypothetical protein